MFIVFLLRFCNSELYFIFSSAKLALTADVQNDDSAYVLLLGVNGNSELLDGFDGTVLVTVPTPDILSGVGVKV